MWKLRRLYALSRVLQVSVDIPFQSLTGPDATTSNSIVHDVHPTHPFLDMKAKPATQTLHPLEISEGITAADDNTDEPESRQRVNLSTTRFSLTLYF